MRQLIWSSDLIKDRQLPSGKSWNLSCNPLAQESLFLGPMPMGCTISKTPVLTQNNGSASRAYANRRNQVERTTAESQRRKKKIPTLSPSGGRAIEAMSYIIIITS